MPRRFCIRKNTLPILVLFALCLPLLSLAPKRDKQALFVIVIDGVRYSETFGDSTHAYIPGMWKMAGHDASIITAFFNDGVTKTVPGQASIATGTWQKIANNGRERPYSPTFFEYLRKSDSKLKMSKLWVIAGKRKLEAVTCSSAREYGKKFGASHDVPGFPTERSDIETWTSLRTTMRKHHPKLVIVNFAGVDIAAHSGNWERYVSAIKTADSLVCEVWKEIEGDAFYRGSCTLFVTGDHGRHDDQHGGFKGHGDGCEGCRHLIFLAIGPQIREGFVSAKRRSQVTGVRLTCSVVAVTVLR
ncbi:MAG: alkaline phosphatase family protein [Candidatus Eisenbacteria bacterium]|nr:alkaline phosphatase family protein [Candidatus Eisenbacteria bacterium]